MRSQGGSEKGEEQEGLGTRCDSALERHLWDRGSSATLETGLTGPSAFLGNTNV